MINSLRDIPNRPKIPPRIGDDYKVLEPLKNSGLR